MPTQQKGSKRILFPADNSLLFPPLTNFVMLVITGGTWEENTRGKRRRQKSLLGRHAASGSNVQSWEEHGAVCSLQY